MSDNTDVDQTIASLRTLLEQGRLEGNAKEIARQCLRRLNHPMGVAIVGTDAVLATGVLNLLTGQTLVNASAGHLAVQVKQADTPSATAYYADKTERVFDGDVTDEAFKNNPRRVDLHLDLPTLAKASFVRITRDDPSNLQKSLLRLAETSDVVLWCGQSFGRDDKVVWMDLPQRRRDHGYMITLPECHPEVEIGPAQDVFADVLALDAADAMAALTAEGGADKAAFKAAGGTDLIRAIRKEIDTSYQAALDAAEITLMRNPVSDLPKEPAKTNPGKSPAAPKEAKADAPAATPAKTDAPKKKPVAPKNAKAVKDSAKEQRAIKSETEPQAKVQTGTSNVARAVSARTRKVAKRDSTPWSLQIKGNGLHELGECVDLSSGHLAIRETSFESRPVDFF